MSVLTAAACRFSTIGELLMRAFAPIPDPDECPEATDKEIPDTDTSDSLQDDLQLSPTCQLLLQLEQSNQVPTLSQLVPLQCAPSGAHPTLLSPPRPALVERQPQTPQPVPLRSRKRTHKGTSPQGRAQEDAALATVIEESVRQMGRVCTRPHLDISTPNSAFMAFMISEVESLPPSYQSRFKLNMHKMAYELKMEALSDKENQE
ncbi:uncharacterized protein LOC121835089 [Ixodes scapularis]|uniref:uncharacterized protein LOC121835089 n=1 Tax=Ixodes scapularis TaxID=6945 RepID=UPI001C386EAA|nr:uncharacterized protein LOC121835089 [Ixodes scapularis]